MSSTPCVGPEAWRAFDEGRAPEDEAARVRRHLSTCEACAARYDDLDTTDGAPSTAPRGARELERGSRLGRYLVLEPLGAGGVGVVYAAYDPELDRKVAIKILRAGGPASASDGASHGVRARLQREAQAMARLAHPNVVAVHDVGTFEGEVFLAMELAGGGSLKAWQRAKTRTVREILAMYRNAGRGLAAAHAAGIVHRDFKPDNVLLGEDGRPRVTDFGLARSAAHDGARAPSAAEAQASLGALALDLTTTGVLLGTPGYMAPEQYLGEQVDPRTDQFSFCAALYEALYDERPFAGATVERLKREVVAGNVREAPKRARVPSWLRKVLVRGLSRAPEDRYPTLDALLDALEEDPTRARRRVAAGAALVTALLASGVVAQRFAAANARMCDAGGAEAEAAWGSAKDAARQAFAATGKPYAAHAWDEASRALDAYAARWSSMHREACLATRVRHEQSEAMLTARNACLASRVGDLKAAGDLFAHADAQVVERAVAVTRELPAVDGCVAGAAIAAAIEPPDDAAARAAIADVGARLAQGRALRASGKYRDAASVTEPLVDASRALGYKPLEAEVLALRGTVLVDVNEFDAAQTALLAALAATEEGRRDDLEADVAVVLANVVEQRTASVREAEPWLTFAEAIARRLGTPGDLATRIAVARSGLALKDARYADAERAAREAIATGERTFGEGALPVANAHKTLGDALKREGRYADAYASFEKARAITEAAVGPDHPDVGRIVDKETVVWNLARVPDEAIAHGRRALSILERALGPDDLATADARSHLAVASSHAHDAAAAIAFETRARATFVRVFGENSDDVAASDANIAGWLVELGRAAEAEPIARRALGLYEAKLPSTHPRLAVPLANLADVLVAMGRPRDAVPYLERARALREHDADPCESLTVIEANLASALWDGDVDRPRALALARTARDQREHAGAPPDPELNAWLASHETRVASRAVR